MIIEIIHARRRRKTLRQNMNNLAVLLRVGGVA
jgi:hypothetical protein